MRSVSFGLVFNFLALRSNYAFAKTCSADTYSVRAYHRSSYQRADGTFVQATSVSESCRIRRVGYEKWDNLLKNGRPVRWPADEKSASWTLEQRERVLEALSELPPALRDIPIQGIFRFKKSKHYPNPGSKLGSNIALFDSAFDSSRNLARILAHELAHMSFERLNDKDAIDYRDKTQWTVEVVDHSYGWRPRSSGFVADDGRMSPDEDYANNVEYILFEPNVLKKVTPQAYQWLRKKFGDTFKIKGINE